MDYATSVPRKSNFSMNLDRVLGESLQHHGIKRNVFHQQNLAAPRTSILRSLTQSVQFLSVHKGCGNGSMIVFTPDGRGKMVNDKNCIEQVQQIMGTTAAFDIVYDRGANVLDGDVNVGVYANDENATDRERLWNQFSCDTQSVLGTSFEPSTAGS